MSATSSAEVLTYKRRQPSKHAAAVTELVDKFSGQRDMLLDDKGRMFVRDERIRDPQDKLERLSVLARFCALRSHPSFNMHDESHDTAQRVQAIASGLVSEYPQYSMALLQAPTFDWSSRQDVWPHAQRESDVLCYDGPAAGQQPDYHLTITTDKDDQISVKFDAGNATWPSQADVVTYDLERTLPAVLNQVHSVWKDLAPDTSQQTRQAWGAALSAQSASVLARTIMASCDMPPGSMTVSWLDESDRLAAQGSDSGGWTVREL